MYFNIKCIGKLPGPTDEFERSLVFETGEFERPKFDCICKGWDTHFQKLATPSENDSFDRDYKAQVDADIDHIVSICKMDSQPIEHITEKEVVDAIRRLKNNKAMDSLGLTSEHFKLGGRDLVTLSVPNMSLHF